MQIQKKEDPSPDGLYQTGAVSALTIVLIYLIEMLVVLTHGLPPTTVEGWFALFQHDRLIGLLQSFALDVIAVSLHAPLYLALYFHLKPARKASAALILSVTFALIGIGVYLASNTTFSLLSLSDQYSAARAPAQKAQLLAAGQALFSIYNGTGPFAAYFLYAVSGILVSIVMLQSAGFSRPLAIAGIIGNALELGLPPSIDPAVFLKIDPILIGLGGILLIYWYLGIAVRLIQIGWHRSSPRA